MKTLHLELPTFAFILGTRAALAAGIALLVSPRIPEARRRTIGSLLVAAGAITTIPAARVLFGQLRSRASTTLGGS